MSAAGNKNEREFRSNRLDSTSLEEAKTSIESFLEIDTDELDRINETQPPTPIPWMSRFTLWNV